MQQYDIHKLIRKFFTGNLDKQESSFLEEWIESSDTNKELWSTLGKVWQEKSVEPEMVNTDSLIDYIWKEGVERGKKRFDYKDWNYFSKVAAIILIFISVPFLIYKIVHGQSITLSDEPTTIVKQNPAGQKSKLYLPDGSIVWLNGASTLSYANDFNDSDRMVYLEGEAFFNVEKNESKPFIVRSDMLTTTALGTSFNIRSYLNQSKTRISLLTGKVKIERENSNSHEIILLPGHALEYNEIDQKITEELFNEAEVIGWTKGELVFHKDNYLDMVNKLETWYGIEVKTIGAPPHDFQLTTSYKDETLLNILKNLKFGKPFNYELKKENLIIIFDKRE